MIADEKAAKYLDDMITFSLFGKMMMLDQFKLEDVRSGRVVSILTEIVSDTVEI